MFVFATLCLLAGVLPGFVIDGLAPVTEGLFERSRIPMQSTDAWLTIAPIAESRSSLQRSSSFPLHRSLGVTHGLCHSCRRLAGLTPRAAVGLWIPRP